MKLFIASTLADTIGLFKKHVSRGKVLFIPNPADLFKYTYWMKKDYHAFERNGFKVVKYDLRYVDSVSFAVVMRDFDIIHICGGSAIYILKLLKEKRMAEPLIEAVKSGRIIYTGTSAGSMIVAPDISFCADDVDEREVGMVGKLKDMRGLDLVPYYLLCHSQEKQYVPSTKKAMNRLPKNKLPILLLNDNHAVWHDGDTFKIETLQ
jgi:dipeptidase E